MTGALQWGRSALYVAQIYVAMLVIGLAFFPWALVSRRGARACCHTWCAWTLWTARWMVGLRTQVRGTPPTGNVLIAAKHQSFLDVVLIFHAVPRGYFIMKHSLLYAPILGQYGLRIGCVPVKRGRRAAAIEAMKASVASGQSEGGQLIIYPQGTRIAPGVSAPYKQGVAALYEQLNQECVPVACNVGVFWPRRGIIRHPGLAVVEFLPPIPAGESPKTLLPRLESVIEPASQRLLDEALGRSEVHLEGRD